MIHTFISGLSAVLVCILILLFPIRKLIEKEKPKTGSFLAMLYKFLRRIHNITGLLSIPVVCYHCKLASEVTGIRSVFGTILLLLLVLLAISYGIRKLLGPCWKRIHQFLAAALTLVLFYHCLIEFV